MAFVLVWNMFLLSDLCGLVGLTFTGMPCHLSWVNNGDYGSRRVHTHDARCLIEMCGSQEGNVWRPLSQTESLLFT